jgi:NADH:ubiquinone oxidoreductase subunit 2 (subunit N)
MNITASFLYLFFYIFLTFFNFTIMLFFFEKNNKGYFIFIDDLSRYNVLLNKNKLLAFLFSFILLSLAGLPIFIGFISK